MITEPLWLLLPVAAASGWWAAMRSTRKQQATLPYRQNPVYFKGLNYLLNEQPDKAIDAFVEMLEIDSDTVETHLALGHLFRQRGEVERAIRIHQNLIARPTLEPEQHAKAFLELGKDYMRAGLYDRAENIFQELRDKRTHTEQALRHLITIYQQEKEWQSCLQATEALEKLGHADFSLEKSHYYCELALGAKAANQPKQVQQYLKNALMADRACVRANHLLARFALEAGCTSTAMRLLRITIERDIHYLPDVIQELIEGHKALGVLPKLRAFLQDIAKQAPQSSAGLYIAELIECEEGAQAALEYLTDYIHITPSAAGLKKLLELLQLKQTEKPDGPWQDALDQCHKMLAQRLGYQCHKCGFQSKTRHWQCPGCHSWSTMQPRSLVETL